MLVFKNVGPWIVIAGAAWACSKGSASHEPPVPPKVATDAPAPAAPALPAPMGNSNPAPEATGADVAALAGRCETGDEVECQTACQRQNARSCSRLARKLRAKAIMTGGDESVALATYTKACDLGYGLACYELKQYATAIPMMNKQCEEGDAESCRGLAIAYETGRNVAKDEKKSAAMYEQACKFGDKMGCLKSGATTADKR